MIGSQADRRADKTLMMETKTEIEIETKTETEIEIEIEIEMRAATEIDTGAKDT